MTSLPSIKVKETTKENMIRAIEKYNKNNLVRLTQQEFRRLSYNLLSQMILQDFNIPIKLLPK